MPAPSIAATNNGSAGNASSHTLNLPSGIAAGHLLFAFVMADRSGLGSNTAAISGWTELFRHAANTDRVFYCFYKIANGSEGASATLNWTGVSPHITYVTLRLTDADTSAAPEISSAATANSNAPNPGSVSPSWGTGRATLYLATCGVDSQSSFTTPAPSGYSGGVSTIGGSGGGTGVGVQGKQATASSDDPGAFGTNASSQWSAFTVAVKGTQDSVEGDLDATESNDTAAASGDVIVSGSLAKTEPLDSCSSSGKVLVEGDLSTSEASDTFDASGSHVANGSLDATESQDSFEAEGELGDLVEGTLAASEIPDSFLSFGVTQTFNPQRRGHGGAKINVDWNKYTRKKRKRPEYQIVAVPRPEKVGPPPAKILPRPPVGPEVVNDLVAALRARKSENESIAQRRKEQDDTAMVLLLDDQLTGLPEFGNSLVAYNQMTLAFGQFAAAMTMMLGVIAERARAAELASVQQAEKEIANSEQQTGGHR